MQNFLCAMARRSSEMGKFTLTLATKFCTLNSENDLRAGGARSEDVKPGERWAHALRRATSVASTYTFSQPRA